MPAESTAALVSILPSSELALALLIGIVLGALAGAWLTARIQARIQHGLHDRFEALSAQALDRSSERFLHLASERLGSLERASDASLTHGSDRRRASFTRRTSTHPSCSPLGRRSLLDVRWNTISAPHGATSGLCHRRSPSGGTRVAF